MVTLAAPTLAQTDEEQKALEEIDRKAAAEKKKTLERIRKKAEEEQKKAAAKERADAAKREKAEAEIRKKAERERAKEPKKEEPEPSAPEPAPPPTTEPPPPPPPPPPAPPLRPTAVAVESVGAARWTSVGFVQPGEVEIAAESGSSGLKVPGVANLDSLSVVSLRLGASQATFNPINDGRTDDDTAFKMAELGFGVNAEFRNVGQLVVPWFDIDTGILFGSRKEELAGKETGRVFKAFAARASGLFGVDFAPIEYVSAGPFVGYRAELYSISLQNEESVDPSGSAGHTGLQYGLHAKLRTRAKPKEPSRFIADARYEWRKGEYQTATYVSLQAGVRAGNVYFTGWYETRLGSSGEFKPSDVAEPGDANKSLAKASAASFPIEQRVGGGLLVSFY